MAVCFGNGFASFLFDFQVENRFQTRSRLPALFTQSCWEAPRLNGPLRIEGRLDRQTHRGLRGRALAGESAGGLTYGTARCQQGWTQRERS